MVALSLSDLSESGIQQNDIDVLVLSKCQGQTLNEIIDVEGTSRSQFPLCTAIYFIDNLCRFDQVQTYGCHSEILYQRLFSPNL